MDDRAISRLFRYIDRYHSLPFPDVDDYVKQSMIYSRWAALEIAERLTLESCILPEEVSGIQQRSVEEIVEEFIDEMDTFAFESETAKAKFIFSIAGDEARRICAYICKKKGTK